MKIDPTTARTATRWLFPVFTSELSFLLRLPLLLVAALPRDTIRAISEHGYATRNAKRVHQEFWKAAKSHESRQAYLYARPNLRKYANYTVVQTIMSLLGLYLNIAWLMAWWIALETVAPASEIADAQGEDRHYIDETLHAIAHTTAGHVGSWMLLASFLLYVVQYLHMRHHLVRIAIHYPGDIETLLPRHMYFVAHFSVVNFLLDLPDVNVPVTKFTRLFVVVTNLVAGSVLAVAVLLQEPMTLAWGCYPPYESYRNYDFGMCPRAVDDPQDPLPPVCDQPGVECGIATQRWGNIFAHDIHIAAMALVASFIVYLPLSFDTRVRFFRSSARFLIMTSAPQVKTE